jgi:hypothetical protein
LAADAEFRSEECRAEAIQAANDCPTGRLVAVDKDGNAIERNMSLRSKSFRIRKKA